MLGMGSEPRLELRRCEALFSRGILISGDVHRRPGARVEPPLSSATGLDRFLAALEDSLQEVYKKQRP
jgi:hypothetical protein